MCSVTMGLTEKLCQVCSQWFKTISMTSLRVMSMSRERVAPCQRMKQSALMEKDGCDIQLQREVESEEEKELKVSRVEFIRKIEDSRSCVVYSSFWWQLVA